MIVLTDIEGTTTQISFVKEVLFPYVLDGLDKFVDDNWDKINTQEIFALDTAQQHNREGFKCIVRHSMAQDLKVKPLKDFQGFMWRYGYEQGVIKGQVYQDVVTKFKEWQQRNVKVFIYSSGSVEAQKLLFGYSEHGDLTKYLSGYFDTSVGHKRDPDSYKKIVKLVGTSDIFFLTDIYEEAEAAHQAGLKVTLLEREGNLPLNQSKFKVVKSFLELDI